MGNPDDVFDYLVSRGATPAGAAGVVGDLQGESTAGLDPAIIGDYGTSGGIAQWHAERWASLKAYASSLGKPWTDLGAQEEYLVKDLQDYGLWSMVTSAKDPAPVVDALVRRYEMPDHPDQAVAARTPYATAIYDKDNPGVWDQFKGAPGTIFGKAKDGAGGVVHAGADAVGGAASSVADKVLGGVTPILWKGLFVALGVGLLGVGVVKALDVKGGPAE